MILCDREIAELASKGMISPFVDHQVCEENGLKVVSYGLSSFGYDIRIAPEFLIFTNAYAETVVDPKNFLSVSMVRPEVWPHKAVVIPPNSCALGRSLEYIRMPEDTIGICCGKSTYARAGIIVHVTPLEPGWEGHITIEISNVTPLPVKVYACEGIMQVVFFRGTRPDLTYADRGGKYQKQQGITLPRL